MSSNLALMTCLEIYQRLTPGDLRRLKLVTSLADGEFIRAQLAEVQRKVGYLAEHEDDIKAFVAARREARR